MPRKTRQLSSTSHSIEEYRFCALPEHLVLEASVQRWTKRHLTWTLVGSLPTVDSGDRLQCHEMAWRMWANVCGLTFEYTQNSRTADIVSNAGRIDEGGRTLAWSELPNGADGPLKQLYDIAERWFVGLDMGSIPRGLIPLLITAAHENGHAIGLGHSNDQRALMYPSLNVSTLGKPQQWDIREATSRYGEPAPPPPPPTAKTITVHLVGGGTAVLSEVESIEGYRLTPLISQE